ncbi:hypothetical protein B0H34DRAFT_728926 [Crassisporium funariophilum]|nr:hypothetical protein B0H34DRAFT_728926 [Crassisporium funariophilum]
MVDPDPNKIQISITFEKQSITFNTKRAKPLVKVFNAFTERLGMDGDAVRFYFDQNRIRPEQTPNELELDNGDQIDATLMQQGGCSP